mgnify:CR=1 FL=1
MYSSQRIHQSSPSPAPSRRRVQHSALTSLDLSRNCHIGDAGAAGVCSVLECNSVLTSLGLSCSGIRDAAFVPIKALLKRNQTRSVRRLALLSLMDEDYNREEGVLSRTNAIDLVFQNEYIISRMYSYV